MASRDVVMPEIGFPTGSVRVCQWLVDSGNPVTAGDPILEVFAGDVVIDIPVPFTGVITAKRVRSDQQVSAGQLLAVVETN